MIDEFQRFLDHLGEDKPTVPVYRPESQPSKWNPETWGTDAVAQANLAAATAKTRAGAR